MLYIHEIGYTGHTVSLLPPPGGKEASHKKEWSAMILCLFCGGICGVVGRWRQSVCSNACRGRRVRVDAWGEEWHEPATV